ncbi:pyridoxamine 5'-phosphate oxidase family protein [Mycobacterium avium]|uniref:pyridoxamine 5'-phosphate oxidase family protein n=1 Tax=Mycobacterium avium TaxID=1764 RepID=UPI003E1D2BEF
MHSVGCEPGRLYFSTYAKGAKAKHLVADPAVACIVLSQQGGHDGPRMSLLGTAEIYQSSVAEVDEMIGARPPDGRIAESAVAKVRDRLVRGKRSFIRVAVDEVAQPGCPVPTTRGAVTVTSRLCRSSRLRRLARLRFPSPMSPRNPRGYR